MFDYKTFQNLDLRSKAAEILGIVRYWNSLGVIDEKDIRRELILATNNDSDVVKILDIIYKK